MKKQRKNRKAGFTLVEIMIATTIFMLVMVMGIGALLVTSNSAKKARALSAAMDNVNFAMENMSRSLRLGSNYYCTTTGNLGLSSAGTATQDCLGGNGTAIVFTPATHSGNDTAFQLSFPDSSQKKTIQKIVYDGFTTSTTSLTSPEVNITELKFIVEGSSLNDKIQPSIYITLKGIVTVQGENTDFSIQTLVSQRNAE